MTMRLTIDSELTLTGLPEDFKIWFQDQLTFDNPKYLEAIKRGYFSKFLPQHIRMYRKKLDGSIIIPRGFLQIVEEALIGQGFGTQIVDNRVFTTPPIMFKPKIDLWSFQDIARTQLFRHPNGMLVSPAGSGKTIFGLDIIASLYQRTLWIVHTNQLLEQAAERITGVFEDIDKKDIGIIGGGKFEVGEKITVALVQTLIRKRVDLPSIGREFGLVILDEAHHAPARIFTEVLSHFASFYMYGLTATPYRRDGLQGIMYAAVGLANAVVDREEVEEAGKIVKPVVVVREVPSRVIDSNDFHAIMSGLPDNHMRTLMIVEDVLREAKNGHHCIVISTRREYCQLLLHHIEEFWPKVGIASGEFSRKHNMGEVKRLESGEINVLITTFELLGEGFDVQKLDRGFIVLPFRERTRVEQAVGRIQRTCEGKTDAILYDYVDRNIGILNNQFLHRALTYKRLGLDIATDPILIKELTNEIKD